VGKKQWAFKN